MLSRRKALTEPTNVWTSPAEDFKKDRLVNVNRMALVHRTLTATLTCYKLCHL